jgi:hypothetical protein
MPPYNTVSRMRMVGRSHGVRACGGRGSQVGLGGVDDTRGADAEDAEDAEDEEDEENDESDMGGRAIRVQIR